jgi:putative endonuclease
MHFVYILFSPSKNQYYIGTTQDIDGRIRRHNSNHKGFTGSASDWRLCWQKDFVDKTSALAFEKKVKGWKSRIMIEKLISEP